MKSRLIMVATVAASLFANGNAFEIPRQKSCIGGHRAVKQSLSPFCKKNLHRVVVPGQTCLLPVVVVMPRDCASRTCSGWQRTDRRSA